MSPRKRTPPGAATSIVHLCAREDQAACGFLEQGLHLHQRIEPDALKKQVSHAAAWSGAFSVSRVTRVTRVTAVTRVTVLPSRSGASVSSVTGFPFASVSS